MARVPGGFGVRRPDRSVSMRFEPQDAPRGELKDLERAAELAEELEEIVNRMPPGSFTQDPGMRAGDEFTDVTSAGYREGAERVAERGGAKEYATSVEEEEADAEADTLRNRVGTALASMAVMGMGMNAALGFGAARTGGATIPSALGAGAREATGMYARVADPLAQRMRPTDMGIQTVGRGLGTPAQMAEREAAERALRQSMADPFAPIPPRFGPRGTPSAFPYNQPPYPGVPPRTFHGAPSPAEQAFNIPQGMTGKGAAGVTPAMLIELLQRRR